MLKDETVFILGEEVARYNGAYKVRSLPRARIPQRERALVRAPVLRQLIENPRLDLYINRSPRA